MCDNDRQISKNDTEHDHWITVSQECAYGFLQCLIGQRLQYGLKSEGVNLYDFGFGEKRTIYYNEREKMSIRSLFILHVICDFEILDASGSATAYDGDSDNETLQRGLENLIGKRVKKISLSSKNDLLLRIGEYQMRIVTYKDDDESWRMFIKEGRPPHLVATSMHFELDYWPT